MDCIGPLSLSQGHRYALTAVDTITGIGFAYSVPSADQDHTIKALQWLAAAYGMLLGIASDRGAHFTGIQIQKLPQRMMLHGIFMCPTGHRLLIWLRDSMGS